MTFIHSLARVKVNPWAKSQGRRLNDLTMRAQINRQMDRHYQVHYLPAKPTRSIITIVLQNLKTHLQNMESNIGN